MMARKCFWYHVRRLQATAKPYLSTIPSLYRKPVSVVLLENASFSDPCFPSILQEVREEYFATNQNENGDSIITSSPLRKIYFYPYYFYASEIVH
jgi:hypothetical protein